MSNYISYAIHPGTGLIESAEFLDDHFGRHKYGVRFSDGSVHQEQLCLIDPACCPSCDIRHDCEFSGDAYNQGCVPKIDCLAAK